MNSRPPESASSSAGRTALVALLVLFGCYLGAAAGTRFTFPDVGAAIVFPSYAVLTAALLFAPVRQWWLFVLAAAIGNSWAHHEHDGSWSFVLVAEGANAMRAIVATCGLRWLGGGLRLGNLRDAAVFLLFAAVLGPAVGATLGAADTVVHQRTTSYWLPWQAWFWSNALTGLTLLPLIVSVVRLRAESIPRPSLRRALEVAALFVGLSVVAFVVFAGAHGSQSLPAMLYGPLPFLLWAAVRFGPNGAITALSLVTLLTIHGAASARGPFVGLTPTDSLLQLQLFLFAVSVPILLLAAVVEQHRHTTAAWRQSQIQYRSVVEDQTELICRFLPDGTYTFVNGAYCRYFQRTPEELLGHDFWQFIPPEAHAALKRSLLAITPTRPLATNEHEVFAPDGEIRWQQWTDRGMFDRDGKVLEYQSVGRDITDRKRAEEASKEFAQRFRALADQVPAHIWAQDEQGRGVFVNARYGEYVGVSAEDLPKYWPELIHPDDAAAHSEKYRACVARRAELRSQVRMRRHDGEYHWFDVIGMPHFEGKRFIGYVGCSIDVTERKQAEDELRRLEAQSHLEAARRQSDERFRMLADHAPVLIWMSGLRNEAIYFNEPWLDFTGRTLEQECGFGWVESVHPDDRERCQATCDAAFAERKPVSMQFRLRRHDGEYRWVLDNGIPHFSADGAFVGYIGSCVDITERQLAEDALQLAGKRKDEFLAMLGHELRNPLAPIAMAVEILRESGVDEDSVRWARDVIGRQVAQLTRIVDDLLDLSRITRGTIRWLPARIDLRVAIANAVETSRPLLLARNHELALDVPDEPLPVQGDLERLVQVISNLLNNAAKYTEPGGRIGLSAQLSDGQVALRVVDNGMGIPRDMLERVFDMFTQVESLHDRSQGGLGIGLTLVKRLVEMHAGTIEARSDGPGLGSEFIVRLPLSLAPPRQGEEEGASHDQGAIDARAASGRKRVLIVDDNVDAAETLARILELQQHEIVIAYDGLEALATAERMHPDVVLLDIGLPKLDGLEVARRIRGRTDVRQPLLVATTGFDQAADRRRIAEAGFDHHLIKPVDPRAVRSLVRSAAPR